MKFTVLFLIAGLAMSAESVKVMFSAKALQPDLDVIRQYYEKSGNIVTAFIHWPNSVTFRVHPIQTSSPAALLKIDGLFAYKKLFSTTYPGLYYGKGKFYFKVKQNLMRPVNPERLLTYVQGQRAEEVLPYLSIRYFSLEELQQHITMYYEANKLHFDNVLYDNPATFLLTPPSSEGHFLEYTFRSRDPYPKVVDGVLQVLTGLSTAKKVTAKNNEQAYRLVFDQSTQKLEIPGGLNIYSAPIGNVIGVRMATTGFLVEVHKSRVKIVNRHDLQVRSGIPDRHFMPREDLLDKVKVVEPRLTYHNAMISKHELPKHARFQVQGVILKKSINYRDNGEISESCPLVIAYEQRDKTFMFGNRKVETLCTNENALWV